MPSWRPKIRPEGRTGRLGRVMTHAENRKKSNPSKARRRILSEAAKGGGVPNQVGDVIRGQYKLKVPAGDQEDLGNAGRHKKTLQQKKYSEFHITKVQENGKGGKGRQVEAALRCDPVGERKGTWGSEKPLTPVGKRRKRLTTLRNADPRMLACR